MTALEIALAQVTARPWQALLLDRPMPLDSLPTPALVLDAAAFERNLARMTSFVEEHAKSIRPHAKTHKCPLIAARQLEHGAVGICTAKISEAAVMIEAGIGRVLVTSPLLAPDKAALAAGLAGRAERLDLVVDSEPGMAVLERAADSEAPLGVLVDVDVAMGRTGTRDVDRVLRLAARAATAPGLEFRGVQHYAGQVMHVHGHAERRDKSLRLWEQVRTVLRALEDHGLPAQVVTGGGTGTYDIDVEVPEITDLQVGSYALMDHEYRLIGSRAGDVFDDFELALTVLLTAISQPLDGAITVDGGFKAFASDTVNPEPVDLAGVAYRFAGDEHGVLRLRAPTQEPLLGSVQRFAAPHCDPTVNLYDWYWVCRDGMITELWPISARGCSW